MVTINKNLMQRNHTARKRTKADIQYIVIHYVGALGDARANTEYYKNNDISASADFWVGFRPFLCSVIPIHQILVYNHSLSTSQRSV